MLDHCRICNKCVDIYNFYGDNEDEFLIDCKICKLSICVNCAKTHIHFVYCKYCQYFHNKDDIWWCNSVDRYENSSECSF